MPEFNSRSRRGLRFRSLLLVAGALMLMAAFVPKADAQLIAYWNFEDLTIGAPATDSLSVAPGAQIGLHAVIEQSFPLTAEGTTGIPLNVAPGDLTPNLTGVGFFTTPGSTGTITLTGVNTIGQFAGFSLSFAVNTNGNGYHNIQFSYQVNGGGFVNGPAVVIGNGTSLVVIDLTGIPAINNQASVDFRLTFSGGNSNGQNLQTQIDNIQLVAVPEPATIAGGLLGVLGLCWHQRRRLIHSVRFRPT
jgi:PEP-CTERM motif